MSVTISNCKSKEGKQLFNNNNVSISAEYKYNYPLLLKVIDDNHLLMIEGKVYDTTLEEVEKIIINNFDDNSLLDETFFNIDGDFNIFLINHKKGTLRLFTDHLNRLPIYYGSNENNWIVTRDIGAVVRMLGSDFDRINLGEFLVFGYSLENRTIFENVYSLKMDCRLEVDLINKTVTSLKKNCAYSFPLNKTHDFSKKNFQEMKEIFIKSCKNRMSDKSILSLSGGMDSRTVAAGLKANGDFSSVSYIDFDKTAVNDAQIASEIADAINCNWRSINLDKENMLEDMEELNRFKYGYQTPNLYFLNQYLKKVAKEFGNDITFFTGDGGDKVFPDLSGGIKYNDDKKLIRHILSNNYVFSLKDAAKLSGIDKNKLKTHISETIISLPGQTSGDKLEYFMLSGRSKRYLFEGEDRNRQFFWTASPFYSKEFFKYMMKIDNSIKQQESFYLKFIESLDPKIARIRNENVSSGKLVINKKFYNFSKKVANKVFSRRNKEIIKSFIKGSKKPTSRKTFYLEQIIEKIPSSQFIKSSNKKLTDQLSMHQTAIILSILNVEKIL